MLTKPYENYEKPGLVVNYRLAAVKIYKGALCTLGSDGYLRPLDPATASLKFIGIAGETTDNSAGAAGARGTNVTKTGTFVFAADGFTPAMGDLGKTVVASSDWQVRLSASGLANSYSVGTIVGIETTDGGVNGVRVRIDNFLV
ncbi:hypothetical protein BH11ARM2_BH11ARM2_25120 [soil metagenome]